MVPHCIGHKTNPPPGHLVNVSIGQVSNAYSPNLVSLPESVMLGLILGLPW